MSQALPCELDECTDVSKPLIHQDSDTEENSDQDINMGMDNAMNVETQVTSPVQFTDESPMTAETVRVTVSTVKSDPDTMARFLC